MRSSEERVKELHRRMDAMKRAKACRRYVLTCAAAIAACLSVTVLLALGVSRLPVQAQSGAVAGMTASVFAGSPALSYIVVALVALILGAMVTVFCFRLRRHMEEKRDDRTD